MFKRGLILAQKIFFAVVLLYANLIYCERHFLMIDYPTYLISLLAYKSLFVPDDALLMREANAAFLVAAPEFLLYIFEDWLEIDD